MTTLPARGEVWWCEMAEIGRRPVVVLSRDAVIPDTGAYSSESSRAVMTASGFAKPAATPPSS